MAASCSDASPTNGDAAHQRSPSLSSLRDFQWSLFVGPRQSSRKRRTAGRKGRDPVVIERSNLVNISKLVVKELIEQSLRYGRMLDSDHMPLQHFFIVLEHVLRHGLRPKKGLLGPKKELWDILQTVEKYAPEAQDITSSVRDLPTVSTHMGRARAWLRLALMQKKLADYLKVLIDHKDEALAEYFEPDALMLSDEAIVIIGLLVGLNVIDCNLCVKEEDLDCPQGVIDFSLYLRSSNQVQDPGNPEEENHMTTVLDQKNYIEELNRHLNATVTNLQNKVESLTTTNALMKEDLAIAKNNLHSLHDENKQLRVELGREEPSERTKFSASGENPTSDTSGSAEVSELKQRLDEERKLRQEADKELQLQMDLKAEMEVAMKLLEKDIHEKQDTIISLRRQLDDIKLINLEMYKKLQECEMELTQKGEVVSRLQAKAGQIGKILSNLEKFNHMAQEKKRTTPTSEKPRPIECEGSLKHKTELLSKLEAKGQSMMDTIALLETKYKECENARVNIEAQRRELDVHITQHEEITNNVEGDLRVEREWRQSLQETMQKDRDKISQLQHEMSQLRLVAQKYASLQEEYYSLKEHSLEQDQTLEELGKQLSVSKLELSDLKEVTFKAKVEGTWAKDTSTTNCKACNKEFNITRRKHHCRHCGDIFCHACSDNLMPLPSSAKPVRVCDDCHVALINRQSLVT